MVKVKTFGQLNDQEKRALLVDIVTLYGRKESGSMIADRHGVRDELIASLASSLRRKGVKLPKATARGFVTTSMVAEFNQMLEEN